MKPDEANDNDRPVTSDADQKLPVGPAKVLGRAPVAPLPKRFYTDVTTASAHNAYTVHLDGRSIKTPKKTPLCVPTQALASAIAAEWAGQGAYIDPSTMPITKLANTTLDAVIPNIEAVRADIVDFAGTDALCYRATDPAALTARQAEVWDPILAWADRTLGARFITTMGIVHTAQPAQTRAAIARAVEAFTPWQIAPLHVLTTMTGSAVLALSIPHHALSAQAAWAAAHIDEDWQIATWGTDTEAQTRRALRWLEFQASTRMLETLC